MTLTLDRPTTTTAPPTTTTAHPLSDAEADTLLIAAAGLEKPTKVKAGTPARSSSAPSPRAWSRGGNVD